MIKTVCAIIAPLAAVGVLIGAARFSEPFISTFAGTGLSGGYSGDGAAAALAKLDDPTDVAVDSAGNVYVADKKNDVIRRVDASTGVITTFAGTGVDGYSGDGGLATSAQLDDPKGVAADSLGNLYVADSKNNAIRKIDTFGVISTIAGAGPDAQDDESEAVSMAYDASGDLYFADKKNDVVRRIDASTGIVTDFAGIAQSGGYSGDGGAATSAKLDDPESVAFDASGHLYIADKKNDVIRKVNTSTGIITTIAGTGLSGGFSGDGGAATSAKLDDPVGVAFDSSGHLYIADKKNDVIRKVNASTGIITTVAGTGLSGGFSGDGGAATSAKLDDPEDLAFDASDHLYISDKKNDVIRKVNASTGIITTFAGTGLSGGFSGDGGAATSAKLDGPEGVAFAASGHFYIADKKNDVIRKVNASTGTITTIAGTGLSGGYSGDDGAATLAQLDDPEDVVFDAAGHLYIADKKNNVIRKVDASTDIITTFAGTSGYFGDGGPAIFAHLDGPTDVATDASDDLYIADKKNHVIRKIDTSTGIITAVAGIGSSPGYSGDGGLAASAKLNEPTEVAIDSAGNLYIADKKNYVIRKVDAGTGIITTYAGTYCSGAGCGGYSGDGGLATAAELDNPVGVAVDAAGNVYIADKTNDVIRRVDASTGIITTFAGTGIDGYSGDGGLPTLAHLDDPEGVTIAPSGGMYIADKKNDVIRFISMARRIVGWQEVDPNQP